MAYISTEKVKNIRNQLKKEVPNLKFSVRRFHCCSVKIVIKSGVIDFFSNYNVKQNSDIDNYIIVNRYNYERYFSDENILNTLKKINEIAYSQGWYDNSEVMIDYFDTAYYVNIQIGDWDKPYFLEKK